MDSNKTTRVEPGGVPKTLTKKNVAEMYGVPEEVVKRTEDGFSVPLHWQVLQPCATNDL